MSPQLAFVGLLHVIAANSKTSKLIILQFVIGFEIGKFSDGTEERLYVLNNIKME